MNVHPSTPEELALAEQYLVNPARGHHGQHIYDRYYSEYTLAYGNQSIANHVELDRFIAANSTFDGVLCAMRAAVGTPGPVKSR